MHSQNNPLEFIHLERDFNCIISFANATCLAILKKNCVSEKSHAISEFGYMRFLISKTESDNICLNNF